MQQYDVTDFRNFDKRIDMKDTYLAFLLSIKQEKEKYPFEYEGKVLYRGSPTLFRIVGFGGYMSESGWRVYFTYRCARNNHVVQYSWRWDYETDDPVDMHVNEFIGRP